MAERNLHRPYNEETIHLQIAEGDEDAFRSLMAIYFPIIVQFARKIVAHDAAAEDIASETFVKLWENRSRVESFQSIKAFLFITSKNSCLNELRHARREERRNVEYTSEHLEDGVSFIGDEIIRAETMAQVLKESAELPEKIRRVFELGYLEGLPNREIARLLKVSVNTIKAQKSRALELLKNRFK